jgi:spore maturation protein CgeB
VNAEPMQKRWAEENGVAYSDDHWMLDIVFAQVHQFQPDALLIVPWDNKFGAAFVERCRELSPSIKLVIGQCGEAHPEASFYRAHDLVITCAPEVVAYLQSGGVKAHQVAHSFDPQIVARLNESTPKGVPPTVDVGFVGQFIFSENFHNARARVIHAIAQQIDVGIYGDVALAPIASNRNLRTYARDRYYALLSTLSQGHLAPAARRLPRYRNAQHIWQRQMDRKVFEALRLRSHTPVFGLEMYQTIAGFKIHLNVHGTAIYASNMRLFETTGVGTCLLTDWKPNIADLFDPDTEIATYRNPAEAAEKARYLLDHDQERHVMARAGQRRTLRDHTTAHRAARIDEIIQDYLRS